jgi:hypothetical protein
MSAGKVNKPMPLANGNLEPAKLEPPPRRLRREPDQTIRSSAITPPKSQHIRVRASVLDCGCPLPLFVAHSGNGTGGLGNWHPKTAKTLMGRLVKKGALEFDRDGRAYLYRSEVAQNTQSFR